MGKIKGKREKERGKAKGGVIEGGESEYWNFFFFFKQKTAYEIYQCDWSSDVCSSDLRSSGRH